MSILNFFHIDFYEYYFWLRTCEGLNSEVSFDFCHYLLFGMMFYIVAFNSSREFNFYENRFSTNSFKAITANQVMKTPRHPCNHTSFYNNIEKWDTEDMFSKFHLKNTIKIMSRESRFKGINISSEIPVRVCTID